MKTEAFNTDTEQSVSRVRKEFFKFSFNPSHFMICNYILQDICSYRNGDLKEEILSKHEQNLLIDMKIKAFVDSIAADGNRVNFKNLPESMFFASTEFLDGKKSLNNSKIHIPSEHFGLCMLFSSFASLMFGGSDLAIALKDPFDPKSNEQIFPRQNPCQLIDLNGFYMHDDPERLLTYENGGIKEIVLKFMRIACDQYREIGRFKTQQFGFCLFDRTIYPFDETVICSTGVTNIRVPKARFNVIDVLGFDKPVIDTPENRESLGIILSHTGKYITKNSCIKVLAPPSGYVLIHNQERIIGFIGDQPVNVVEVNGNYYLNEAFANESGYKYCDRSSSWKSVSKTNPDYAKPCLECVGCGDSRGTQGIAGYGSIAKVRRICSESTLRCFGVEFEKEDKAKRLEINEHGWMYYLMKYKLSIEADGSLDSAKGFEAISPVMDLDDLVAARQWAEQPEVAEIINSTKTKKCGGHMHFSHRTKQPLEVFREISGYLPLLYSMYPSRISNSYCWARPKNTIIGVRDKYCAVFIRNETVEFRIFPSPANIDTFIWRAELIRLFMDNPAEDVVDAYNNVVDADSPILKHLMLVYSGARLKSRLDDYRKMISQYEGIDITATLVEISSKRLKNPKNETDLFGNEKKLILPKNRTKRGEKKILS